MKRFIFFLLLFTAITAVCQPKYEVRAVWLTTIGGIDWPRSYASGGNGIAEQRRQFTQILDNLQRAGVNTILLQCRIRGTTIFPSQMEPFDGCLSGHPGVSPGYDALQMAIEECHRRGMELHAWVVTIPMGKWNGYGCQQLRRTRPKLLKKIGEDGFLNPESQETADYLARFCADICQRYDVDGIHLDYIRYPETWKGSKRADNITHIVRTIHQRVKAIKPWIKLSCSPIGKYDDLSRYSSRGWNARRQVAQDAQGWLRQGIMDQLYPMMYFKENNFYPFAIDWQDQSHGRTIVSGLGIYMLHPKEGNWPLSEVRRQLNVTRSIGIGHCYFRAKFLLDNTKGILDYVNDFDRTPALVPPMTWAHSTAPLPPTSLRIGRGAQGDDLSWSGARDRSKSDYLLYNVYADTKWPVDIDNPAHLVAMRRTSQHIALRRDTSKEKPLFYAVTAVDRYGNESTAIQEPGPRSIGGNIPTVLLSNDGSTLKVPEVDNNGYIAVCTMQGSIVNTYTNRTSINISTLPEGMYELRSLHPKGISHRLGHFIIRRH